MMNAAQLYTLSKPQKTLVITGSVLFAICIIIIGTLFIRFVVDKYNRPIRVLNHTELAVDQNNNPQPYGFHFEDTLEQSSGRSEVGWGSSKLALFTGTKAQIFPEYFTVSTGYAYLDISAPTQLMIGEIPLSLSNVKAVYESGLQTLIILEGGINLPDGTTAMANQLVFMSEGTLRSGNFDRTTITTNTIWPAIIQMLTEQNRLPLTLADLVPPVITITAPVTETESATISLIGSVDSDALVTLDGENLTLVNREFSQEVSLDVGANEFTLSATDDAGNIGTEVVVVTRLEPAVTVTTPVVSCNQASFTDQFLCLINQYRTQSGLNTLVMTAELNSAAKMHSDWMYDNQPNPLTHTWTDGTEFWQRCESAGTTCDAENIAWHTSPSAQTMFTMWQQSATHNENMLGSHSYIGVALTGGYATTVFY